MAGIKVFNEQFVNVFLDTLNGGLTAQGPFDTKAEARESLANRREDSPLKWVATSQWRHVDHTIYVNLP